jgi:hypothetical protein
MMDYDLTDSPPIDEDEPGCPEGIPPLKTLPILTFVFHAMSLVSTPTIQVATSFEEKLLPLFVPLLRSAQRIEGEIARDMSAFNWRGILLMIEQDDWRKWMPKFCSDRIKTCQTNEVIIVTTNRRSKLAWTMACKNMHFRPPIEMIVGDIWLSAMFLTGKVGMGARNYDSILITNVEKSVACRAARHAFGNLSSLKDKFITYGTTVNGSSSRCEGLWDEISDERLKTLSPLLVQRYMRPKYLKSFTFDLADDATELKSVKAAELHVPFPSVPDSEEIQKL